MGLDGVELVMEFEDEFGFRFSDEAANDMLTVGDTFDYVLSRLRANMNREDGVCPSARAFYHLRRELISRCGVRRAAIRPDSLVVDLIPDDGTRKRWAKVASAIGVARDRRGWFAATRYPFPAAATVREIVLRSNGCRFVRGGQLDENAAWSTMRTIIGEQMGIRPQDVRREHRWVQDIGI